MTLISSGVGGCRLVRVRCPIFGGDEDAAELGEHVGGGRLGLGGVPGRAGAVIGDVGGVVPGGGVPGGGDGLAGELERDGALDGAGGAVAGLACAEDLPGVLDRHLDAPSGGIPLDQLRRAGVKIGGDQGQPASTSPRSASGYETPSHDVGDAP